MIRAVIVEDEMLVAQFLSQILKEWKCDVVKIIYSFENALETIIKYNPDIVFLDINLGTKDTATFGLEIAEGLTQHDISIVFVTAYNDDMMLNKALKCSPENYITKPFTPASIRIPLQIALNKINKKKDQSKIIKLCDNTFFHQKSKLVIVNEEKVFLTSTEFNVLDLLCYRTNSIVTYDIFNEYLWQFKSVSDTALRELIARLRKKIPCINIKNRPGIGYELVL